MKIVKTDTKNRKMSFILRIRKRQLYFPGHIIRKRVFRRETTQEITGRGVDVKVKIETKVSYNYRMLYMRR